MPYNKNVYNITTNVNRGKAQSGLLLGYTCQVGGFIVLRTIITLKSKFTALHQRCVCEEQCGGGSSCQRMWGTL